MSQEGKKFNETVTAFFPALKFGKKNEQGEYIPGTGWLSAPLNAEALTAVTTKLTLGSKLIFKESTRKDKNGKPVFYLEIMKGELDTSQANRLAKPYRKSSEETI